MALSWAHPIVREWFNRRFESPTEPQLLGWPHIVAGRDTLISAPTGSGKTLAAFLACIDRLVRSAADGTLENRTEVLYVSPLKALGNDIQKNLDGPLAEIGRLAFELGQPIPDIRTAVRTGDTLMPERRAMLRRPPHILVTTPESLYILLTAERSRAILRTVSTVIVDEIHAVADDKRGAHLAISLERLDALCGRRAARIGLSATQKPIELVARFLGGRESRPLSRPDPVVVQVSPRRELDIAVEVPSSELGPVASNELWNEIYDRLAVLAREHRSTLIFVNTRRLAERVTHHLAQRLGNDAVAAHHGSLSRKTRLTSEHQLKTGALRALVATASLELGIDIGTVDLVCQIGSPRAVAAAVQRIGRAGHWRGAVPKGRFFVTTRDELIECAALVLAIRRGELDKLVIPEKPLDILAQQIVASCAAESEGWDEDQLFELMRRAYPYRSLERAEFDEVIEMLSEGIASRRGRYGAYLHRDRVNRRLRARRGARLVAITGGGAIPETALYTVVAQPEGTTVGTVDEDFAVESSAGDIMLLGNTSWRIRRVGSGRMFVEDAHGAPPTIPFWRGEAPARTTELSEHVAEVREQINQLTPGVVPTRVAPSGDSVEDRPTNAESRIDRTDIAAATAWLVEHCGLSQAGAEQAVDYVVEGRAVLRGVPTQQTIIAERFFDEGGGMQLVIHAPFGGRINKAWGLALRKRFCRSFNFELQAAATDDGINIALAEQHSFPLGDVFRFLSTATVQEVLEQAVLDSPLFGTRWRWDASRSLALVRFRGGKKVPLPIQRMQSDDLLASVFPDAAACQENIVGEIKIPDHPLVREVMKDVLTEAMDIDGLKDVLERIADGRIETLAVDTPVPSAFSHEILNANPYAYLDDAPLEERRARAVEMRRMLPEAVLTEIGRLDPAAVDEVVRDAWPDVRDRDELQDALQTLIGLPDATVCPDPVSGVTTPATAWPELFDKLVAERRAARATSRGRTYWVSAERARTFLQLFPDADFVPQLPEVQTAAPARHEAALAMVHGWMIHSGPVTIGSLAARTGVPADEVETALLTLEAQGVVLRGQFVNAGDAEGAAAVTDVGRGFSPGDNFSPGDLQWCERRLLARIHRLTLGRLRREIEPVAPAVFMRWLLAWQHVSRGTQVFGERGTLEVVRQLQGFEAPANAWEPQLLARRIARYDPQALDQLCLTGAVGWGRLSPHPATLEAPSADSTRRVTPTSVAPITFFVRDEADWMSAMRPQSQGEEPRGLSPNARAVLSFLHRAGASFFADIVRATRLLKAEVEGAVWELVAAGLVTADGFDNLRALIDPRRRAGHGSAKASRPRHSTGRWSLLYPAAAPDEPASAQASDRAAALEATCRMLLRRYGIVFRELLARETILATWRELLITFRRLEDRGDVRGGRFISGLIGEQFALPVAVDSLRAARHAATTGETITISAADPLNLVGIIVPGERVPAISGRYVTFRDGVAIGVESQQVAAASGVA
ncbi:MAG TPA: DEAD/DEAH box helicase [Vicinamibacterales bacterium]|nr:DEAD/DEAH box helicase [Vicinamibacterales bacterium]